jgi:hypothetical protein
MTSWNKKEFEQKLLSLWDDQEFLARLKTIENIDVDNMNNDTQLVLESNVLYYLSGEYTYDVFQIRLYTSIKILTPEGINYRARLVLKDLQVHVDFKYQKDIPWFTFSSDRFDLNERPTHITIDDDGVWM